MKRNKKEEKWKALDRLYKYYSDLDTSLIWVPVEEPQFLGWELTITLGESGLWRRDAEELLEVMRISGMNRTTFTRYEYMSKLVKSANYSYMGALDLYKRMYNRKHSFLNWDIINGRYYPYFFDNEISEMTYNGLPSNIQRYFSKYENSGNYWRPAYFYYKVSQHNTFPFYELKVKVTKAYSTHRGIPQAFNESEESKLHDKFTNECYWSKRFDSGNSNHHWSAVHNFRKKWKKATTIIATQLDEADNYELIEKYECKLNKRVRTPWD